MIEKIQLDYGSGYHGIGNPKYTVVVESPTQDEPHVKWKFHILRHGEEWRDMTGKGDNVMLSMFYRIQALEEQVKQLEADQLAALEQLERNTNNLAKVSGYSAESIIKAVRVTYNDLTKLLNK